MPDCLAIRFDCEVRREVEDIKRQDEKKDNTKPQGPAQP